MMYNSANVEISSPEEVAEDTMTRILVVDDERVVTEVVEQYLRLEGFEVAIAIDGEDALQQAQEWEPDLIVLDLMLPKMNGLEVCRRLRHDSQVPIIMLTARSDEADRIVGLELGADDYVAKPFSPRELVARAKSVLRRSSSFAPIATGGIMRFDNLTVNPQARTVTLDGADVHLTGKEFDLLFFLASNSGQVFTREQIMDQAWDYTYAGDTSTVTVHIRRLREKVEVDPVKPRYIKTVWGVGYKFDG